MNSEELERHNSPHSFKWFFFTHFTHWIRLQNMSSLPFLFLWSSLLLRAIERKRERRRRRKREGREKSDWEVWGVFTWLQCQLQCQCKCFVWHWAFGSEGCQLYFTCCVLWSGERWEDANASNQQPFEKAKEREERRRDTRRGEIARKVRKGLLAKQGGGKELNLALSLPLSLSLTPSHASFYTLDTLSQLW